MDTLFHYCSASAFTSIISYRNIWLSSLKLSNDSMEGKIMTQTFKRIFEKECQDNETLSTLGRILDDLEDISDGAGFCLSESRDTLSQWRGYADDGHGFSIGFSKKYLNTLSEQPISNQSGFSLKSVIYDPIEQEDSLLPTYNEIASEIKNGKLKHPHPPGLLTGYGDPAATKKFEEKKLEYNKTLKTILKKILPHLSDVYRFKHEAFSEENEWRLITLLTTSRDNECEFRSDRNKIIPYRTFYLKKLEVPEINEVIIGPKNITPMGIIEKLLENKKFSGVKVTQSSATYR